MMDFEITGSGTIYTVKAVSPEAKTRLAEIKEQEEIPAYMCGTDCVHVEHRYVSLWHENLLTEGFTVQGLHPNFPL